MSLTSGLGQWSLIGEANKGNQGTRPCWGEEPSKKECRGRGRCPVRPYGPTSTPATVTKCHERKGGLSRLPVWSILEEGCLPGSKMVTSSLSLHTTFLGTFPCTKRDSFVHFLFPSFLFLPSSFSVSSPSSSSSSSFPLSSSLHLLSISSIFFLQSYQSLPSGIWICAAKLEVNLTSLSAA